MTCQQLDDILIDYIEGHLSLKQRMAVKAHLKHCSNCQVALSQQKDIVKKLHRLPQFKCPDTVVERVFNSINIIDEKVSFLEKIYQAISERLSWKISFAAAIAVIAFLTFIFYPDHEKREYKQPIYTAEEIEQAQKDVELALGYFHYFANKTEIVIEDQVLSKQFVKPIRSTLKIAFKPLLDGGNL